MYVDGDVENIIEIMVDNCFLRNECDDVPSASHAMSVIEIN
jgi:hypothetical protein